MAEEPLFLQKFATQFRPVFAGIVFQVAVEMKQQQCAAIRPKWFGGWSEASIPMRLSHLAQFLGASVVNSLNALDQRDAELAGEDERNYERDPLTSMSSHLAQSLGVSVVKS